MGSCLLGADIRRSRSTAVICSVEQKKRQADIGDRAFYHPHKVRLKHGVSLSQLMGTQARIIRPAQTDINQQRLWLKFCIPTITS